MKKRIFLSMILAAVMLAAVLAGCSSGGSAAKKEEPAAAAESTQEEAAPAETKAEDTAAETESTEAESTAAAAEENTGLANPWSDVGSAEEAAKGAGIDSFVIAEDPGLDLGELFERTYRCMDGIAEARLEYPASALTVRKGTIAEEGDISGDYTEYANTWTQDVNGIEVTCFGNREDDATKSIWTVDNMYFSIVAEGLGGDQDFGLNAERLTAMVNSIQ
jgi:outer membrane murein-binding lipoprotein Lpp